MNLNLEIQKEKNIFTNNLSTKENMKQNSINKLKTLFHKFEITKSKLIILVNVLIFLISFGLYLFIEVHEFQYEKSALILLIIVSQVIFFTKFFSFVTKKLFFIFDYGSFFFLLYALLVYQLTNITVYKYKEILVFNFIFLTILILLLILNYMFIKKVRMIYLINVFVLLILTGIFFCYICNFNTISLLFFINMIISSFNNLLLYYTRNVFTSNVDLFFNIFTINISHFGNLRMNIKIN